MNRSGPAAAGGATSNGHGAEAHRGRFSLPADLATSALETSMHELLRLGDVAARRAWSDVGGVRLHYLECGSGPVVVVLQGASGGAANWYRLLRPLSEHFRVLAPDLPGFGFSEPIEPEAPLGLQVSALIRQWLAQLAVEPYGIVGTSFGGLVALRLAEQLKPDRLVLIDSAGLGRALPVLVRLTSVPGIGPLALRPSRRGTAWLLRNLVTNRCAGVPLSHQEALIEYLWRSAAASDLRVMARAVQLFADRNGQREVIADLAAMSSPTLLLWGEHDRFFPPSHGREAAARMPRARFELIPGSGHSPNWEAADHVIRATLPFLLASTVDAA
jgi:pimeloyl-ACP methyl ester carboxylesterase